MKNILDILGDGHAIEDIVKLSNESSTYINTVAFNFTIEKWMVMRVLKALALYQKE